MECACSIQFYCISVARSASYLVSSSVMASTANTLTTIYPRQPAGRKQPAFMPSLAWPDPPASHRRLSIRDYKRCATRVGFPM